LLVTSGSSHRSATKKGLAHGAIGKATRQRMTSLEATYFLYPTAKSVMLQMLSSITTTRQPPKIVGEIFDGFSIWHLLYFPVGSKLAFGNNGREINVFPELKRG
jgi:hypothetical protein